jgi:hypothetical protein
LAWPFTRARSNGPCGGTKKKLHDEAARPASESDSGVAAALTELYERLRGQVLNGLDGAGETVGFGVLMNQGMGAWILKCREFTPAVADADSRDSVAARIPFQLEAQVVAMIAGMVLNHSRRELQ